jgi:soluble lytic murein transglycosylase-like protein
MFKHITVMSLMALSVVAEGQARKVRKSTEWDQKLVKVANKEGVPAFILSAICWVESTHRPHATHWDDGVSDSIGLCQIKVATAAMFGFKGNAVELYDGLENAKWAARYLKYQFERYGDWKLAIAAYNSGSVRKNEDGSIKNQVYIDKVVAATIE